MPQDRSLRMGVLALALIVFGVFIYCGAQAGGKKESPPPPRVALPLPADLTGEQRRLLEELSNAKDLPSLPSVAKPQNEPLPLPPQPPVVTELSGPAVAPRVTVKDSIWSFGFEMKEGRTLLTAKVKGREFKVSCDGVDMQTPRGQVVAQGKVRLEGPQLEATGEKLTIHFGDEQMHLEGKAQVKCGANMEVELVGERLSLKTAVATREPEAVDDGVAVDR